VSRRFAWLRTAVLGNTMIRIITMEREYGCGGGEIAQRLAEQLSWKLWDQLLTEEIARLADCPKAVIERRESEPTHSTIGSSNRSCAGVTREPQCAQPEAGRLRGNLEVYGESCPARGELRKLCHRRKRSQLFLRNAKTHYAYFSMLQEKIKYDGWYPRQE